MVYMVCLGKLNVERGFPGPIPVSKEPVLVDVLFAGPPLLYGSFQQTSSSEDISKFSGLSAAEKTPFQLKQGVTRITYTVSKARLGTAS